MMKKFTKMVMTSSVLMTLILNGHPVYANEKTNTTGLKVQTNYKDEESLKELIQDTFQEDLGDLKIKAKNKDSITMESSTHTVVANGIDIDTMGEQNVRMTLVKNNLGDLVSFDSIPATTNTSIFENEIQDKKLIVTVKDEIAPEIKAKNTYTVEKGTKLNLDETIKAYDNVDDQVPIQIEGNVNYQKAGQYTVVAKANDNAGNESEKKITIQVEDNFYDKIASAALAQVGVYQDCTMLVTNALRAVGINFHGAPEDYLSLGQVTNDPVPGDIIVYSGHVALYIGNGQAVHGGWLGNQTIVSSVECTNPFIAYVHVSR